MLGQLDDDGLLAALRQMLGPDEQPPEWSVDLAKSSYPLRAVDTELAVLISDSGLTMAQSTVRSGALARLAAFNAVHLSVEIEIEPGARADSWRLIGQLIPASPARIEIRQQRAAPVWIDADDRGRFSAEDLASGPLSLICARSGMQTIVTEWIPIG